MEVIEQVKEIREILKERSKQVKPLVENGEYDTVNEAIIDLFYRDENHKNFRLFNEWRKDKHKIVKGSRGFPVWTRKKENQKITEVGEVDEYKFFGVCYLFSNAQVMPMD